MPLIIESSRFVPLELIPLIPEVTPLPDVFSRLSDLGVGGFVASSDERPRYHVTARHLTDVAVARAMTRSWQICAKETSRDLLNDAYSGLVVVFIADTPVSIYDDALEVRAEATKISPVVYERRQVGWFFPTRELGWDATLEPPTKWNCLNPNGAHSNPGPDNGTCSKCPYPIIPAP